MLLHEMLKEIKDSAYIKKITQDSVTKKEGDFKDSSDVLTQDPLTEKGEKIMSNMKEQYGEKKGEQVFYASKNKGTIEGVDSQTKDKYIFSETYKGWKIYETDNGFEATNLPGKEPIKESSLEKTKLEIDQYENYKTKDESKKKYVVLNSEFNQHNYKDLIGKEFDNPPAYAQVRVVEEKKAETADTDTKAKSIIEIYPTGDPFGRGFEASQSVDGGKSWVYRGDLGRQSREFWRTYCQTKGYTLRTRDAAPKSLKVKTKDAVLCGDYKGFQIHQVSDSKFTAFTNFGSSQPGVELIGNSIDDIKNKIDQYDEKSQSGNDYSEKEMNTRDSKTKDESPAIGKHSDVPDDQFNQEELQKGIEIEKEHTDDPELAKQIAKDHLSEVRDYYTRLIAMEAEAKENKTENDLEDNQ